MNLKKLLALMLALLLVVGLLAACGGGDAEEAPEDPMEEVEEIEDEIEAEIDEEIDEEDEDDEDEDEGDTAEATNIYEGLVGIWAWDEADTFEYEFHADGTGIRGVALLDLIDEFTWSVDGDELIMVTDAMTERWTWVIEDEILTITSRQVPGMEYSYIRIGPSAR